MRDEDVTTTPREPVEIGNEDGIEGCDLPGCEVTNFERGWLVNTGRTDTVTLPSGRSITVPIVKMFCTEVHAIEWAKDRPEAGGGVPGLSDWRRVQERAAWLRENRPCPTCKGTGDAGGGVVKCPACEGRGYERWEQDGVEAGYEPGDRGDVLAESLPWDDPDANPIEDVRRQAERERGRGSKPAICFEVRDDLPEQTEEEIALLHGCQCEVARMEDEAYTLALTEGSPTLIHTACGTHVGGIEPEEFEAEGIPVRVTRHVEFAYPGEVDALWLEIEPAEQSSVEDPSSDCEEAGCTRVATKQVSLWRDDGGVTVRRCDEHAPDAAARWATAYRGTPGVRVTVERLDASAGESAPTGSTTESPKAKVYREVLDVLVDARLTADDGMDVENAVERHLRQRIREERTS